MRSIRNVNTTDYLGTPTAEAQIGKMREPSTGGYTVIEPDLAFDLKVQREMNGPIVGESQGPSRKLGSMVMNEEEEEKKRPPKRYFQSEFAKGGKVSSKASSRADGCAQRGKTKGRMV